jgi:hypothetical protein
MTPAERPEYFPIELPEWPGVVLTVARTVDGRLYFPVRTMCGILGIDPPSQVTKLQTDEDFAALVRGLPMPTLKGTHEMLCLEWEGMGGWLTGIQSQRVRPEMRDNVRRFRRQVWIAANELLLGRREPTAQRSPVRGATRQDRLAELTSLVLQVENRLGAVEGHVFIPEHDGEPMGRDEARVTCPSCGFRFGVRLAPIVP